MSAVSDHSGVIRLSNIVIVQTVLTSSKVVGVRLLEWELWGLRVTVLVPNRNSPGPFSDPFATDCCQMSSPATCDMEHHDPFPDTTALLCCIAASCLSSVKRS